MYIIVVGIVATSMVVWCSRSILVAMINVSAFHFYYYTAALETEELLLWLISLLSFVVLTAVLRITDNIFLITSTMIGCIDPGLRRRVFI